MPNNTGLTQVSSHKVLSHLGSFNERGARSAVQGLSQSRQQTRLPVLLKNHHVFLSAKLCLGLHKGIKSGVKAPVVPPRLQSTSSPCVLCLWLRCPGGQRSRSISLWRGCPRGCVSGSTKQMQRFLTDTFVPLKYSRCPDKWLRNPVQGSCWGFQEVQRMPPLETIYRACILLQKRRCSWDRENACLLSLRRTPGKIEGTQVISGTSLHAAEHCTAVGTLPLGEQWIFPVNLSSVRPASLPSQTCIFQCYKPRASGTVLYHVPV